MGFTRDEDPERKATEKIILNGETILLDRRQEMLFPPSFNVYPQDEKAKGTWWGLNSYGLIFCLMNETRKRESNLNSRGEIILSLIKSKNLQEIERVFPLNTKYNPFLFFAIDITTQKFFMYSSTKNKKFFDQRTHFFKSTTVEKIFDFNVVRDLHFSKDISVLRTKSYTELLYNSKTKKIDLYYYNERPKNKMSFFEKAHCFKGTFLE